MNRLSFFVALTCASTLPGLLLVASATAQVAAPGWVLGSIEVGDAPGDVAYVGTSLFVAAGSYGAGSQRLLRVDAARAPIEVVDNLNSIGGIAWDRANDFLYFTDNAEEAGATTTGDTVYRLLSPLGVASVVDAATLELAPAGSIPQASLVLPLDGDSVLVTDSAGPGAGSVLEINSINGTITTVVNGLDYVSGLSLAADGDLLIGNVDSSYVGSILRWDAGTAALSIHAVTGGAFDQVSYRDGSLLVTGVFAGDFSSAIAQLSPEGAPVGEIASGFSFSAGLDTDPISGQVAVTDSCWPIPCTTITTLTPLSAMTGTDQGSKDCNLAFFGGVTDLTPSGNSKPTWTCTDGDACDRDANADGSCTFLVGACVGLDEIDGCAPATVDSIEVSRAPAEGGSSLLPLLQAAVDSILPASDAACSAGVAVEVEQGHVVRVKLKARDDGKVVDRDNLKLACR